MTDTKKTVFIITDALGGIRQVFRMLGAAQECLKKAGFRPGSFIVKESPYYNSIGRPAGKITEHELY